MRSLLLLFIFGISIWLPSCSNEDVDLAEATATDAATLQPVIGVTLETITPVRSTATPLTGPSTETEEPTFTPTPILYTVQAGDTMFDIAVRFQLAVEELQNLNPDIDPNLLYIGQQLILPPGTDNLTLYEKESSSLPDLKIEGLRRYPRPDRGIWILGEVTNTGDVDVEYVQVEVSLVDSSGDSVMIETFWAEPGIIPAGAKAPFGRLLEGYDEDTTITNALVREATPLIDLGNRYLDFGVQSSEVTVKDEHRILAGILSNSGPDMAGWVVIVATLYDEEGGVTGYYYSKIDETISPGDTHSFEIELFPPGQAVESFSFLLQGVRSPTN